MDAGDALKRAEAAPSGADIVSRELDEFNGRYQYLIDLLYGRLQEIASFNPNDIVTLVSFFYFFVYKIREFAPVNRKLFSLKWSSTSSKDNSFVLETLLAESEKISSQWQFYVGSARLNTQFFQFWK